MLPQKEQNGTMVPMTVIEGLTVNVLPNSEHEFLMSSKEVSVGYGTSDYTIRQTKIRHEAELIEGKHFVSAVTYCHSDPHNKIYWTKRGIIRLGFFIKSERARLFRDWAEDLIIKVEQARGLLKVVPEPAKQLSGKRRHNRLTPERLISIMGDVCRIEDKQLRLSISDKLLNSETL